MASPRETLDTRWLGPSCNATVRPLLGPSSSRAPSTRQRCATGPGQRASLTLTTVAAAVWPPNAVDAPWCCPAGHSAIRPTIVPPASTATAATSARPHRVSTTRGPAPRSAGLHLMSGLRSRRSRRARLRSARFRAAQSGPSFQSSGSNRPTRSWRSLGSGTVRRSADRWKLLRGRRSTEANAGTRSGRSSPRRVAGRMRPWWQRSLRG